ncbi:MAG: 16S rRNA (guanine(966)-N(2))-methyltransferase RsmD [Chloroflexota bacterium]
MADAGRVIAGTARGIRLEAPGEITRPLGDRVKQTLFAILEPVLVGANVLDLFAGSGAAGIEALSRGAAHATFVERDKGAAAVIATNLGRTHLAGSRARIIRGEALAWLTGPEAAAAGPFDVVVVDPPYAETALLAAALEALGPHLTASARVVAKHPWRDPPPGRVGLLASERERRFGETTLTFYRRAEDR